MVGVEIPGMLGVTPFVLFSLLFLILPTLLLMIGAFQDAEGTSRWRTSRARRSHHLSAYWISIQVSTASALLGA